MSLLINSSGKSSDKSQMKSSVKAISRQGATRSGTSTRQVPLSAAATKIVGRFFLFFLMMVLVVGGFGVYKAVPHLNPVVDQVIVAGEMLRLDQSTLSRAVHENLKGGILTLDIEYLRTEISRIAWVEAVELVKQYPSTLLVHITEEQSVARWNDQGYISNTGEFIKSGLYENLASLPLLTSALEGVQPEQSARDAVEVFHRLNSIVLMYERNIRELHQSSSGGWTMVWDNGLSIDLGRVDHLNRTRNAMAAWQRLPAEVKSEMNRMDARYDNGVAVRAQGRTDGSARSSTRQEVLRSENNSIQSSQSDKSASRKNSTNLARLI